MLTWLAIVALISTTAGEPPAVSVVRLPAGALQPQTAAGAGGTAHVLYFAGPPEAGDLWYTTLPLGSREPVRVNQVDGSAVALGSVRGGRLALGKNDRAHVVWNGSGRARPRAPLNPAMPPDSPHNGTPLLYSRLDEAGKAFEPERNLMTSTVALDGGAAVAADGTGRVVVAWHAAPAGGGDGEASRRVYVATSIDSGATFSAEAAAFTAPLGACACCGMAGAASGDTVRFLFRAAGEGVHRDMHLLWSSDGGRSYQDARLHAWEANSCPMTTSAVAPLVGPEGGAVLIWETKGRVYRAVQSKDGGVGETALVSDRAGCKHPAVAVGDQGRMLVVWAEGTGWAKGGAVGWVILDKTGQAVPGSEGRGDGLPAWSFPAGVVLPDGGFAVLY
jgi:hypothetical protein